MVTYLDPPELPSSQFYSHVAVVDGQRMIYISGQQALDATGQLVGHDDFPRQAEQVFANLKRALAAAGAGVSDVIAIDTHFLDRAHLPAYREARTAFFAGRSGPAPTSTTVQVSGLVAQGALLEVGVTAVVPPRTVAGSGEPITVVATLRARAERGEDLQQALLDNAELTRTEAGCLGYVIHHGADDPTLFVLYETWRSREALAAHFEMPYMKALSARRAELFEHSHLAVLRRVR